MDTRQWEGCPWQPVTTTLLGVTLHWGNQIPVPALSSGLSPVWAFPEAEKCLTPVECKVSHPHAFAITSACPDSITSRSSCFITALRTKYSHAHRAQMSDTSLLPTLHTGRTLFPTSSLKHYSWHQLLFSVCVNEIASKETDIEAGKKDAVRGLGLGSACVCVFCECLCNFFSLLEGRR